MKNNDPIDQEEALDRLLQEWRSDASLPPRFQEQVWRRIERAQAPTVPSIWSLIAHWIGTLLPRPLLAASYLAVLVSIGVSVGWTQARQETARVRDELGERYVRLLNPYTTPRE